jgi:tetratricopeptide (TPR) repeat protein
MPGGMNEELQNLIERYRRSHDSRLFAPLADAYRKNGEVDAAIEILERGIEKFPDYASAHVILGKCYYDKGATERAKSEFERVLGLDADNMVALKFMGDILLAEDKKPEAAGYFKKILAIDPMNDAVAKTLKAVEETLSAKEIDLTDRAAVKDERPRELATMTLAGIYAAQGYYNKALRIYGEVLDREPENREAKEMVGKLQSIMKVSDEERGKAFEERVLTISVDDITNDVAASTAGPGGTGPGRRVEDAIERAPAAPAASEARAGEPGAAPDKGTGACGEEAASGQTVPAGSAKVGGEAADAGEVPEEPSGEMDQFRQWVERLKKK